MKALPFALCMLFLCSCALDRPPSGGPPDEEPLQVVSADPEPSSVNITPGRIRFGFNRYVTTSAFRRAVVFSPPVSGYSLKADGTEADIVFNRPLDSNKTYSVTLNRSLRSSRGNELEQSYTYAFSTGPVINRGVIEGKVFSPDSRPAPGATVLAFALAETGGEALDPTGRRPDYSVQTGRDGAFRLDYLAEGPYRLVALQDRNSDMKIDPQSEPFGVGASPVVETGSTNNLFRLADPRQAPVLRFCSAPADNMLELSFDRTFPLDEFAALDITVLDTTRNSPVEVRGFFSTKNENRDITYRIVTGRLSKDSGYRITCTPPSGIASSAVCRGSGGSERKPLVVDEVRPADGERKAFLSQPVAGEEKTALIRCSAPVDPSSLRRSIRLYALQGATALPHEFRLRAIDARRFALQAEPAFRDEATYRIEIATGSIEGLGGEKAPDSLLKSTFTVAGADAYGEISGMVRGAQGTVVIEAVNVRNGQSRKTVVSGSAPGLTPYRIGKVAPGDYLVNAFVPRAGAGNPLQATWNPGGLFPFSPADRFTVSPDTVTVRKGWATENVMLEF